MTLMTLPRMLAARRAAEIEPFQVMDVLARAHALEAAGRRVVHMEIGEPDFTAPEAVVEAGVRALRGGLTAYTATLGLPALRQAIATLRNQFSGRWTSRSHHAGASGGLLSRGAVRGPGRRFVPDPGYLATISCAPSKAAAPVGCRAFQPTLEVARGAAHRGWSRLAVQSHRHDRRSNGAIARSSPSAAAC
jgi:aspartate/methionine/tyrosine aminotransferase